jgi:Epoxide hydrolase N terminus
MTDPVAIGPFTISVEQAVLSKLRDRIRQTRWPHVVPGSGWEAGADSGYLRSLLDSWADGFDWRAQERELNRLGHFRADVDGVRLHFIHERGNGPAPLPIVLTHGFPSSFVEYLDLLPLLTDPVDHGGRAEDAFDVVVVSPPGYGFAEPVLEARLGDLWCRLMCDGLGYTRFGAHGSDAGAGPTTQLGVRHPEHVVGIHMSAFYLSPPPEPWPPEVKEFIDRQRSERAEDTAYSRMQSTRPQTAAFGLTDSPAGLATWVIDLFRAFSDCGGDVESRFSRERLLTNLILYWAGWHDRARDAGVLRLRPLRAAARAGRARDGAVGLRGVRRQLPPWPRAPSPRARGALLQCHPLDVDAARRPLRGARGA